MFLNSYYYNLKYHFKAIQTSDDTTDLQITHAEAICKGLWSIKNYTFFCYLLNVFYFSALLFPKVQKAAFQYEYFNQITSLVLFDLPLVLIFFQKCIYRRIRSVLKHFINYAQEVEVDEESYYSMEETENTGYDFILRQKGTQKETNSNEDYGSFQDEVLVLPLKE
eukprot:snap_masked-scaffold_2-processed-gene-23.25-mRNA-1 protein AED:1.00 eAED:1.00 QI:0/-1/0/0/-1/1/1/0/165